MISILPPEQKEQIRFSKYNVTARHYLIAIVMISLAVGASLYIGHYYADQQIADYEQNLEEIRSKASSHKELQSDVETLNTRLTKIDALLESRTSFSNVLSDLASVLPSGAFINGVSLTGEVDQPLELTITTRSRDQSLVLRNALLTSPRITTADIQSISPNTDGGFNVVIIVGFNKEGTS